MKQQDKLRRNYEERLKKFEELIVEQQRKMLTTKTKIQAFFSQDAIVNAIAEFN